MARKLPVRPIALEDWPAADRVAWSRACAGGGFLDEPGALSNIKEAQRVRICRAYGSWLGYLADNEGLKIMVSGVDYLRQDYLRGFLHLLETHVAPSTTRNYLFDLLTVAPALRPEADLSDLSAVTRRARRDAKPVRDKRSRLVPSSELWKLGCDLMDTWDACATIPKRLGQYRDGLMIALLASRPIRCKNLAQIEIGLHLPRMGKVFWLFYDAKDMKNRRSLEFPLPQELTDPLQYYLDHVRPELINQRGRWKTDVGRRLWVGEGGSAMKSHRIHRRICQRTEERFGHPINPHLFRDAAATSIAEQDPEHVGMIRAILGHTSPATSEDHYNHASSLEASRRYQRMIEDLRET